jgi:hypothetical protein
LELCEAPRVINLVVETLIDYVFSLTETVKNIPALKVNGTGMVKDHSYTTVIDSIEFIGVIEIFHLLG